MNVSEWTNLWKGIQKRQNHNPQKNQMYSQSGIRSDVHPIVDSSEKVVMIKMEKTLVLAFNM